MVGLVSTCGEGTPSRVTAADRFYVEFYDFYSVRPENSGYHLVLFIICTNRCTIFYLSITSVIFLYIQSAAVSISH